MKAVPWQLVCCIAIADIIASSMPLTSWQLLVLTAAQFDLMASQLPSTPSSTKKLCLYFSKSHLIFSHPIDAEELQSLLKIQTGLFLCPCVFMRKFFAAFVIMSLVFLLFVVLSCACDYLYYKCDPGCYERM